WARGAAGPGRRRARAWPNRPRVRRRAGPGGSLGREASLVSSPFREALQAELGDAAEQLGEGDAAGFPQLGVRAGLGEAGHRVDLVQEQSVAAALQEEVDARKATGCDRLEGPHRQSPNFLGDHGWDLGRNERLRARVEILGAVV